MGMLPEKKYCKNIHASESKVPVAATHPPMGGSDPGIAPIEVFNHVSFFNGVYTNKYINEVINAKTQVAGLINQYNKPLPTSINNKTKNHSIF